jgi:polyribonucleotide nucleotidyltransferase
MNKIVKKEIEFAGKKLILETGELALRADVAVKATYGDTVVLTTVAHGPGNPEADFLGLRVEYEEKLYASGSIKSSRFMKRDGRSTDDAIVSKRAIDHAIRPLFPKDFMDEVQVANTILSLDEDADVEFLTMVATSACLHASVVPWGGPMATAKVGLIDKDFVLNPTRSDMHEKSDLEMLISFVGEDQKFLAVEASANILSEEQILGAINHSRDSLKPVLDLILDFSKEINPKGEKYEYDSRAVSEDLLKALREFLGDRVDKIYSSDLSGNEISEKRSEIVEEVFKKFEGTFKKVNMAGGVDYLCKDAIRNLVLTKGKRLDGRGLDDVRPISTKVGVLPRAHGTGLFTRGNTQALTVTTLGSPSEEILIQDMYGERSKKFMHYYNFPPYSTGEVGRFMGPKGREIGHGVIAERGLSAVMPSQQEFPYTVIAVSEILSSNGSSSMAATCGSSLSLMDAGVPIKAMVGGIAMGLIIKDETFKEYKVLTDLSGEEDFGGFLDFKMTGTREGVTAIQCDMKVKGIPMNVLEDVVKKSKVARMHVLDEMEKTISKPKDTVSEYAPKSLSIEIDPDKIGTVIGGGGKTIKDIQERTGTKIHIEDSGIVTASSLDMEGVKKAIEIVEGITHDVKPGEIYEGTVEDILDFGALVNILPGKTGLLHVSELADKYVDNVRDYVKVGDVFKVKVLRAERDGKIALSRKALEKGDSDK